MSLKDKYYNWVEERKFDNEDGTFSICDPANNTTEDEKYTENEIDDILWTE